MTKPKLPFNFFIKSLLCAIFFLAISVGLYAQNKQANTNASAATPNGVSDNRKGKNEQSNESEKIIEPKKKAKSKLTANNEREREKEAEEEEEREKKKKREGALERLQRDQLMMKDPRLGYIPNERLLVAKQYKDQLMALSMGPLSGVTWKEQGPNNQGGRCRAMVVDPNDGSGNTVWAGSVGGGLWKTTNINASTPTWVPITDLFPNLAITSIAFDPSNTQIMYFTTGEGYGNADAIRGLGVWKSTDGGNSWAQLAATNNSTFYFCQKVLVSNTGAILVATSSGGLQRSINGGTSFSKVLGTGLGISGAGNNFCYDVDMASNGDIYSTLDGSVHKSTNAGATFGAAQSLPITASRIELACAPNDANYVYALVENGSTVAGILQTTDAGTNWLTRTEPDDADPGIPDADFSRGQAWYDLSIAVDPNNKDRLFVGAIDIFVSGDGANTWSQVTHWYGGFGFQNVHADQHNIIFQTGSSSIAYFSNDGGIYRATNANAVTPTITRKDYNFNTAQFYSCAIHPTAQTSHYLAGAQDNGSHKFVSNGIQNTTEVTGGDGAFCHIDQDQPQFQFTSYVNNDHYRSSDGGFTWTNVTASGGRFINPTDYDDVNNKLYCCRNNNDYLRWDDPQTGNSFSIVSVPGFGGQVSAVKVSPNTANRVFFGIGNGDIFRVDNAHTGTPTATNISTGLPSGYLACIEVETGNDNHLLVTYSNYGLNSVWESTDGGTTWTSIEGNLPDMPIRWALFNPSNSDQAILATELGVWSTDDLNGNATNWGASNSGLANVRVDMLQVRQSDKFVIAATHGRGLFASDLFTTPTAIFDADKQLAYVNSNIQFTNYSYKGTSWSWDFGDGSPLSTSENPTHSYTSGGKYSVTLTINAGAATLTKTQYIHILPNRGTPYVVASDGGTFETNFNDFGSQSIRGGIDKWERGVPSNFLTTVNSPVNVWKTDLDADLTPGDYASVLQTPSYNFTAAGTYTLRFRRSMEVVFCNAPFAVQVQYSTDKGLTWTRLGVDADPNATNWYNRGPATACPVDASVFADRYGWTLTGHNTLCTYNLTTGVPALIGQSDVTFRFVLSVMAGFSGSAYAADGFMVDDFEILGPNNPASGTATIVTTGTLNPFTSCAGIVSAAQSFTVSGSGLTANLDVTAPTGYEVSLTAGSGYAATLALTPVSGNVNTTTIFVRLTNSASGTPSGNVACTSAGAITQNIAVSGTVHANPSPSISGSLSFCAGGSTTLDAGAFASYLWSNGATTQSILVNTANTFTVTVTDGNGCTGMASVTTTVNANPSPSISGSLSFCAGGSTTLDAGSFASYLWSTGATTQSILVNTANTFTVTVTDGNGCTGMASVTTTVNANPSPSISGSLSFCAGGSTTLDAGSFASYLWSTGATTQSILVNTANTFTVTVTDGNGCTGMASVTTTVGGSLNPTISGSLSFCAGGSTTLDAGSFASYLWSNGATTQSILVNTANTFTVTVTDGNGCTGMASVTTTVNANPSPSISGSLSFCAGGSTTLDAGAFASYLWSNGATTQSILVNTANTFTVTVTDGNGCTGMASVTTTVNANPSPSISGSLSFCAGGSTTLDAGSLASYLWSTGATTQSILVNTANTFTVTVTDGNGCTGMASVTTTVNANPSPSISGSLSFCAGGSTTLDAGAFASYLWSNGATTQSILVNTANTFTVTVTDGNGCTGMASVTTTVNANPSPSISGSLSFCAGGSTTLDAGSLASYLWSTGATTQSILVNTANTFTVTVTDGNGCTGMASVTTTVNANPSPSISGSLSFCAGGSTTLDAGSFASYLWSTGATTQSILVNTANTFTVTVTDGNGCTGMASVTTTVNANPSPSISGSLSFCAGGSTTLDAGAFASYLWSTGATTQSILVNTANTFTVTVTDGNGCTGMASVTTTVNANPSPSISGSLSFCAGGSTTLDAGAFASYLWSNGATTQSILVNTANTFTVTVTDGNGCTGMASVTTTVSGSLNPTISGSLSFCAGGSTTLDAGAFASYLWSTGATTQSILVNTANTFTVTVTDGNGCTGMASVTTTVNANPSASISGSLSFCAGGSTTLDAGAFASYLWSTGATTQSILVNTANTFTVTVTDGNGCTGMASVTTTVNANPSPSISGSLSFCAGGSTTLDAGAFASYLWSNGATTQSILVNTANTFTVTVTDGNGCTGMASVTTTVNANPSPSISGSLSFCAGGSTTLDAGAFASYLWSNGATTQSILVNTANTFTVTVTDGNGCTGMASVTTTVNANPSPSISGSLSFCAGGSTTLDAGSFASYLWSTGATTQSILVNTANTFTVTVTDGNGCTGMASVTTTVNANPSPSISGSLSFCAGGSTTLDAGAFASYLWSNGATTQSILVNTANTFTVTVTDGNGCTGMASVTTTVNANPSPSISGSLSFCAGGSTTLDAGAFASYLWSNGATTQSILVNTANTFTVTVTDGNGCTGMASVTTTVNANPSPSISGSLSFCAGGSTTLDAGSFASYLWSTGATTQSILVNTANTFTVTVTDGNGCTGMASVTTTVNANPSPSISGSLSFCAGGSTTLDAGAFASYLWSNGATTQSILVNTANTFTVTVTDGNGCTGMASVTTTVNANPSPSISGSLSFCAGGSTTLDAGAFASYLWSNGATTQSILVNTANTFTVTVTDGNGCTGMASVTTTVNANPSPSISGSLSFCAGGSTTLDAGSFASYLWSNGATTQSILVNTANTFTVTVTDGNGCTGMASVTTTIGSAAPAQPGIITGPIVVCKNSNVSYSIAAVPGATSYTWSASSGASVSTGQGSTNVVINFSNLATNATLSVVANNTCGSSIARTLSYTVASEAPAKPATINGMLFGLCNKPNVPYSCPTVVGATSYLWTVPTGVLILSGQGTNAITVQYTASFTGTGTLSVVAQNGCGSSAVTSRIVNAKPQQPVISGQNWACKGQAGLTYSVSAVPGATSYQWIPVPGSTITSGQGTTSITYKWGNIHGVVKCIAKNACGNSIAGNLSVSFTCKSNGIDENFSDITLYPNPASETATLSFESFIEGEAAVNISDMIGQQLLSDNLKVEKGNNNYILHLSEFPKGVYLVSFKFKGISQNSRLIIQ